MSATNVEYYICGFDAAGHRVYTTICPKNPDDNKINELKAAAKKQAPDAVVVELVSADDYNLYLAGNVRDSKTGKPVPYVAPEPTEAERKAASAAVIAAKYEPQLQELKNNMITAVLLDDTELQAEIKAEYVQTTKEYNAEMEAANND